MTGILVEYSYDILFALGTIFAIREETRELTPCPSGRLSCTTDFEARLLSRKPSCSAWSRSDDSLSAKSIH